ncbi:hypothetical protein RSOL_491600 [Rhizoctonia solani AG-3 Rhs1AP]|uniref:DUF6593 domain-containing protein n=1 Tax=Rhizoctonia solani AG-3 Rhs1AP TaxID=1086054 RepID=X8JIG1_9AGAM|nr:hypothetical protein RSOL_491600 [Rhizoctonia solani AG-3 Rhs1AP]
MANPTPQAQLGEPSPNTQIQPVLPGHENSTSTDGKAPSGTLNEHITPQECTIDTMDMINTLSPPENKKTPELESAKGPEEIATLSWSRFGFPKLTLNTEPPVVLHTGGLLRLADSNSLAFTTPKEDYSFSWNGVDYLYAVDNQKDQIAKYDPKMKDSNGATKLEIAAQAAKFETANLVDILIATWALYEIKARDLRDERGHNPSKKSPNSAHDAATRSGTSTSGLPALPRSLSRIGSRMEAKGKKTSSIHDASVAMNTAAATSSLHSPSCSSPTRLTDGDKINLGAPAQSSDSSNALRSPIASPNNSGALLGYIRACHDLVVDILRNPNRSRR